MAEPTSSRRAEQELFQGVSRRRDPKRLVLLVDDFDRPNGPCVSSTAGASSSTTPPASTSRLDVRPDGLAGGAWAETTAKAGKAPTA
jgi:hypothetical protein